MNHAWLDSTRDIMTAISSPVCVLTQPVLHNNGVMGSDKSALKLDRLEHCKVQLEL